MTQACIFLLTTLAILAPILPSRSKITPVDRPTAQVAPDLTDSANDQPTSDLLSVAVMPEFNSGGAPTDSSLGLTTFLKYWEMKGFIFMIVVENLKLDSPQQTVWFCFAPEGFRRPIANSVCPYPATKLEIGM